MKATLFALFTALLMVGCGEVVDIDQLQYRGGVMYLPNEETPFTGKAVAKWPNGQECLEHNYKDGKRNGLYTSWYKNGQKMLEINYKDGKQDGLSTHWYDNGQKEAEITYKDGKQDGLWIIYNQEGTETGRETYKNGELVKD